MKPRRWLENKVNLYVYQHPRPQFHRSFGSITDSSAPPIPRIQGCQTCDKPIRMQFFCAPYSISYTCREVAFFKSRSSLYGIAHQPNKLRFEVGSPSPRTQHHRNLCYQCCRAVLARFGNRAPNSRRLNCWTASPIVAERYRPRTQPYLQDEGPGWNYSTEWRNARLDNRAIVSRATFVLSRHFRD